MTVELLVIDVWVIESLSNVVSGVVVEVLGVVTGVGVLAGVNVNVLAAVMTALEFSMSIP